MPHTEVALVLVNGESSGLKRLHCNLPLRPVPKADVCTLLPESVRVAHQAFTTCDSCGRVFWKGSHRKRMAAMLDGVTAAVESTAPPQPGPR